VLDDPRVLRAMEAYTAALQRGERPDRSAFLAGLPADVADALAGCLEGLELVHAAVPELSGADGAGPIGGGQALGQPLGDFRILREVGRGGMGVVYEAEQLSLRRRVALKVLPLAAAMDPKQLQRFRNESLAAASLHHEHIVPVYAVGCERGVHYYAMQFIDGVTAAQLIPALHRPAGTTGPATGGDAPTSPLAGLSTLATGLRGRELYRTVARMGVQAARALEHAHSMGIVHRDVKPGNLLVDAADKVWFADFGLARFGADAGLTLTGDLLGTMRYMSPEQALAKHGLVDHRTDVYGLGATLYELLTGRPAVEGTDRQEVLGRIALDEPVPPRRHDRELPVDLETILLKALRADPAERYPAAAALADDLQRWLDDRPITARRPTAAERARQWARRHHGLVGVAVLALALAAAGAVAAAALIARERAVAVRERDNAIAQKARADRHARMAAAAAELFGMRLGITRWEDEAEVGRAEQRQLYEGAVEFYQELVEEAAGDPARRGQAVLDGRRLARLRNDFAWFLVRQPPATADDVRRGRELAERIVAQYPDDWRFRNTLGVVHYRSGSYEQAIACLEHAVQLRGGVDGYNGFFLAMAHARLGHSAGARQWFDRAAAWTATSYPREPELIRFRAEAAAVLGIADDAGR
jgi:tetratricopeptide (TPR) repeat protein